jgi:hypothetical protein
MLLLTLSGAEPGLGNMNWILPSSPNFNGASKNVHFLDFSPLFIMVSPASIFK